MKIGLASALIMHLSAAALLSAPGTIQDHERLPPSQLLALPPTNALIALPPLGPADLGSLERAEQRPRPIGLNRLIPAVDFLAASEWEGEYWESTVVGPLWRLRVQSQGAESVRLKFRDFSIGEGRLWIQGEGGQGFGPYSATGPFGGQEFWTPSVQGETVIVEYLPAAEHFPAKELPFRIDQIGHTWKSLIPSQLGPNPTRGEMERSKPVSTAPRALTRRKLWARLAQAPPSPEPVLTRPGRPIGFSLPATGHAAVFVGSDSYRFELREGAEEVEFVLRTVENNTDVDLFVRFGQPVEISDGVVVADYTSDSPTGAESITLSRNSDSLLRAGTYFVALGNHSPGLDARGTLLITPSIQQSIVLH